jgi:uncharacterized lipoprotein YajG
MKVFSVFFRSCVVFAVSAALTTGCTVAVKPHNVPLVKGVQTGSLKGLSLIVVNAEKDSSAYEIMDDKGQKLGITANRREWAAKLAEALSEELARRGARLRSRAAMQVKVAIPEIVFSQNKSSYQFSLKVAVSTSKGWSKTYDAVSETTSGLFESPESLTVRMADKALADAVKAMLGDTEFIRQLGKKT